MLRFLFKLIGFVVLLPFRILLFPLKALFRSLCRRLHRMPFVSVFLSGLIMFGSALLIKVMTAKKKASPTCSAEHDDEACCEDACCTEEEPAAPGEDHGSDETEASEDNGESEEEVEESEEEEESEEKQVEGNGPDEMELEYTLKQYGLFNFLFFSGDKKPKKPGQAKA